MTTHRVHGAGVSEASLAAIYSSPGFRKYIESSRDNSDGTHQEISARNPVREIRYAAMLDRLFGIGDIADFLDNGGKLKPAPSQSAS